MWRASFLLMLLYLVRGYTSYVQSGEANMRSKGFYFGEDPYYWLLGCENMQVDRWVQKIRRNILPSAQGVMKQYTAVWKNRQRVSYVTSIYIILLRIDSIAVGCSVFIFRTKEQKSISYRFFWEIILTSIRDLYLRSFVAHGPCFFQMMGLCCT
jgi:hypothetical protein